MSVGYNHRAGTTVQEAVITAVNTALSDGQPFTAYDVQDLLDMEVQPTSIVRVLRSWTDGTIRNRRIRKMTGGRKLYVVGKEPGTTRLHFAIRPPKVKTDAPLDPRTLVQIATPTVSMTTAKPNIKPVEAGAPCIKVLSERNGSYLLQIDGEIHRTTKLEW